MKIFSVTEILAFGIEYGLEAQITPSGGITPSVTVPVSSATPNRRARTVVSAAVVALLTFVAWWSFSRTPVDSSLDPDMLAVAPFEILGSGIEESWGEDLAVLLRNSLDGVGAIRTEDASVAIGRWAGLSETSASAFGRSLGSGLVLTGTLVPAGQDSVRVTATLFDVTRDAPVGNAVELRLGSGRIDNVADSIVVGVLRNLDAVRDDVGAFELRSVGSTHPAAIRAFLNGERHRRAGTLDSAILSYERAIAADSSFALAVSRQGILTGWGGGQDYAPTLLRAGRLNHGLAPRESLLVVADSIRGAIWMSQPWHPVIWPELTSRLFSTLETATNRYRNDPQVWYALAEAQYHLGWMRYPEDGIVSSFARAAELDSAFLLPLVHLIDHLHGDEEVKLGWIQDFLAGKAGGALAPTTVRYRQLQQLISADIEDNPAALDSLILATADSSNWSSVARALAMTADRGEKAVRIVQVHEDAFYTAMMMAYRGHLEDALQIFDSLDLNPSTRLLVLDEFNRLGVVPSDSLVAFVDRFPLSDLSRGWGQAALESWLAATGDSTGTAALDSLGRADVTAGFSLGMPLQFVEALGELFGVVMHEETLVSADSAEVIDQILQKIEVLFELGQSHLQLSRGDTVGALAGFEEFPASLSRPDCPYCYQGRMLHAGLLVHLGRDREAAQLLDRLLQPPGFMPTTIYQSLPLLIPTPASVLWRFERARVNDRLGNTDKAIAAYSFVVHTWANADSILQANYVTPAREALARLVGEQ